MSKRNGFTLVELMVVIVIIGVLAAVAIPKMMAATAKAKASEGPQILGAIERLQHVAGTEYGVFIKAEIDDDEGWEFIGMSGEPNSKYFTFNVAGTGTTGPDPVPDGFGLADFIATATAKAVLVKGGSDYVQVDNKGDKEATKDLNILIGSYGAKTRI
jgi:prepilin-type N-terminal cleavage/methylation domain-containing protein